MGLVETMSQSARSLPPSETPRTDAQPKECINWGGETHELVDAAFARQLERELNTSRSESAAHTIPSDGTEPYHPPFVMMKEEGDHWIQDSKGLPVDRGEILRLLNTLRGERDGSIK